MESMVAKLQELIDRKPQALSIFLSGRFGIQEEPTPLLLLGLYKLHGENFLNDLSIIFDGQDDLIAFTGIALADSLTAARQVADQAAQAEKQQKRQNTIKAVGTAVKFVSDAFRSSKSSGNSAGDPPPPEEPPADKTKKVIIIGAIVIVVLIVIVIVIKKFKK